MRVPSRDTTCRYAATPPSRAATLASSTRAGQARSERVLEDLDVGAGGAQPHARDVEPDPFVPRSMCRQERLGESPQLPPFRPRDGLVAAAERRPRPRLHLAEYEEAVPLHDQIELAERAPPVASDEPEPPPLEDAEGSVLAPAAPDPALV